MTTKRVLEERLERIERARPAVPESVSRMPAVVEVTAVDTGAGTCTVKRRFDNDQLIDATERSGIVYDTEPSVGDIGIIGKLGSGAPFFFERAAAATQLQLFAGAGTLRISDSTVYSRTTCGMQRRWTSTTTSTELYRGILKFNNPIVTNTVWNTVVIVPAGNPLRIRVYCGGGSTTFIAETFSVPVAMYPILDDFDLASDDYTTLSGLTLDSTKGGILDLKFALRQAVDVDEHWICGAFGRWPSLTMYGLSLQVLHANVDTYTSGVSAVYTTVPISFSDWQYAVMNWGA